MNHYSDIGFSVKTPEDMNALLVLTNNAKWLPTKNGGYFQYADKSGAELYFQILNKDQLIGISPHFAGKRTVKIGVMETVMQGSNEMEGSYSGWVKPDNLQNVTTGLYPLIFDVPDFCAKEYKLPFLAEVQLNAFALGLAVFKNENAFNENHTKEGIKLGSKYFSSSGVFHDTNNKGARPKAEAFFAGRVLKIEIRTNNYSKNKFGWMLVDTFGGPIDTVFDLEAVDILPKKGNIVEGSFWLTGRIKKILK